jgi:hypothetical protein
MAGRILLDGLPDSEPLTFRELTWFMHEGEPPHSALSHEMFWATPAVTKEDTMRGLNVHLTWIQSISMCVVL